MSIASEIQRLQGVRTNIFDAITNKGVTVPSGSKLADCPELISLISGGGGDTVVIGGREYRIVTIGNQTWLAENLDFWFSGLSLGQSGTSSSEPRGNYYQNNSSSYGKYGILYNWIAVKYLEDNKSSLIPGWHVPTVDEWDALATAVGGTSVAGTKLKSTTDWSSGAGTDDYGFSALPAGAKYNDGFYDLGYLCRFWTIAMNFNGDAYNVVFNTDAGERLSADHLNYQFSVRLVKDSA